MSRECHECSGRGGFEHTDWECCGHYLPSGECCAAIYGQDRLVPVPSIEPCQWCDGTGVEPDEELPDPSERPA
jgi:DnaJ-class molecular chaperone